MRFATRAAGLFAVILAVSGCEDPAQSASPPAETVSVPLGSGFDFYVLALSWSPSYCASFGDRANRQQCDAQEPFGFVVHGLWPQFARGYPTACRTDAPLSVPRALSDAMLDIMPSTGLVWHEWREHGTCSGLTQDDYFAVTRMAFDKIVIPDGFETASGNRTVDPDTVEDAFAAANPGLPADAIAVTCDRRYVRDVRICLSRDLSGFVACPEVDADACERSGAVMPAAR
jgi:ribonuclease T2